VIIHFDKKITEKNPSLYDYVESKGLFYPIYYMIDHKLRTSVRLSGWLKDQVDTPCQELKDFCKDIKKDNYDYIVTDVLRKVIKNFKYITDDKKWKVKEKWQTPKESLTSGTGDCEDGAILIYCACITILWRHRRRRTLLHGI
jgi:hypothetical protein